MKNNYSSDPYRYEGQDDDESPSTYTPTEADKLSAEASSEVYELRQRFGAAYEAASVRTMVYDPDGGTSWIMKPPAGWTFEGGVTAGHYIRLKATHPINVDKFAAEKLAAAAVWSARASAQSEADEWCKLVGWPEKTSTSDAAALAQDLSAEIKRGLPKALRRLL